MSSEQRHDDAHYLSPFETESYWLALLSEGENTRPSLLLHSADTQSSTTNEPDLHDDWREASYIMQNDLSLMLPVVAFNRGGLLVEWRNLRGFVPASQLISMSNQGKAPELGPYIGSTLTLRIIELSPEKNRFILSERAAQVASGTRAALLGRLQIGEVISGRVTNLCDFGAFVDLGGVEGLIHISELSWGRVNHPADLLQRGQTLDVFVMDVNPNLARVALSLKRLHPDPWMSVEARYKVGEIVEGRITNVVDFGAFACLEDGLEGLIHFSELAEGHFLHPRNVVNEGELVHARILSIDGRARRLGLSLRLE